VQLRKCKFFVFHSDKGSKKKKKKKKKNSITQKYIYIVDIGKPTKISNCYFDLFNSFVFSFFDEISEFFSMEFGLEKFLF
jgi:phosphomevalonate kinase